jgi:hypothetical protein
MKPALYALLAIGAVVLVGVLAQSGPAQQVGVTTPQPTPRTAEDVRLTLQRDRAERYFQRLLITFGADSGSRPYMYLAMLGFNGRQLQGSTTPIAITYDHVRAEVLRVADVGMRRQMLLELFNEVED